MWGGKEGDLVATAVLVYRNNAARLLSERKVLAYQDSFRLHTPHTLVLEKVGSDVKTRCDIVSGNTFPIVIFKNQ